jgi:hypothetical protein
LVYLAADGGDTFGMVGGIGMADFFFVGYEAGHEGDGLCWVFVFQQQAQIPSMSYSVYPVTDGLSYE